MRKITHLIVCFLFLGNLPFVNAQSTVFEDYLWLSDIIDVNDCANQSVTAYGSGAFQFLYVDNGDETGSLYLNTDNGTFYCSGTPTYDCVAAYNLSEVLATWTCGEEIGSNPSDDTDDPAATADCSNNIGTIVFAPCGEDGETFVFIETEDGQLYDLYYASGIVYQAIQGQRVNFDFINAEFESPCSNATQAIRATCIENIPTPTMTCSMETGTFFFTNCDDGTRFFFIETVDGRILDPYFDAGVSHNPIQGQRVNFDYADAGNSPCTIAEKAVSITCIEVVENMLAAGDCNNNRGEIFFAQCDDGTDFFFIRSTTGEIFDPYYATGINFEQYDGAQILFDFVPAGFTSPCSQAEQAITITCIEEIVPTEVNLGIPEDFENYDLIYRICRGDALEIPNFKREIQCNCPADPQAPCDNIPFNQWAVWSGGPLVDNVSSITVSPTLTTTYEAEINAFFCGVRGPAFGPAATTTVLVIVDNSSNCDLSNAINQTSFEVSGCPDEVVRIPAPNPDTCPLGPPIQSDGVVEVLTIAHDYLEVRLLGNGSFTYSINEEADLDGVTCPTATYAYTVNVLDCINDEPITKIFDYRACVGDKITLPVPTSLNCDADHILDNEEIVEILAMTPTSMDVMLLRSGHVSVSALGRALGCANTSHVFSFVADPNCEEDGLTGNTSANRTIPNNGFIAYPSPTQGTITVQILSPSTERLVVYDVYGRTLQHIPLTSTTYSQFLQLDMSDYHNGIYYIELQTAEGSKTQRIVKQ